MIDAIFASRELQHKIDEIATAHSYGGQKEKLIEEMSSWQLPSSTRTSQTYCRRSSVLNSTQSLPMC